MAHKTAIDPTIADFINKLPDQTLEDIVANIREGADSPAKAFGFDAGSMNAIESMALGYYRARQYDKAALIFSFLLNLDPARTSAWRGLGAVGQALKKYEIAVLCYDRALRVEPTDHISRVLLGECFCQVGQKDPGLKLLKEVVALPIKDPVVLPYVARAKSIISADGGVPNRFVLMNHGKSLAAQASRALAEQGFEVAPAGDDEPMEFDPDKPLTADAMLKNPQMKKMIGELKEMIGDGRLTWAQVGGFTKNEMDGAYACAAKYAEMGQVMEAMQITGYLMFLNPYDPRFFQLAGVCLQRMKQYVPAEHYYKMALVLDKEDIRSQIYMGECMIMDGRVDDGVAAVRQGMKLGESKPDVKDLVDRGKVLVKQFARA